MKWQQRIRSGVFTVGGAAVLSLLALSFASSCGSDSTGSDDPAARRSGRPGAGIRVGSDHGRIMGGWVAPGISPKAMRGGVPPGASPKAIATELGIDADAFIGAQQAIHDEKKAEYVVAIAAELGISTATLQQAIDDAQAERKAPTMQWQQRIRSGGFKHFGGGTSKPGFGIDSKR